MLCEIKRGMGGRLSNCRRISSVLRAPWNMSSVHKNISILIIAFCLFNIALSKFQLYENGPLNDGARTRQSSNHRYVGEWVSEWAERSLMLDTMFCMYHISLKYVPQDLQLSNLWVIAWALILNIRRDIRGPDQPLYPTNPLCSYVYYHGTVVYFSYECQPYVYHALRWQYYLHAAVSDGHGVVSEGVTRERLQFAVLSRGRCVRHMVWVGRMARITIQWVPEKKEELNFILNQTSMNNMSLEINKTNGNISLQVQQCQEYQSQYLIYVHNVYVCLLNKFH